MENVTLSQIHKDLLAVRKELEGIKERMLDADRIMSYGDFAAFEEYKKEKAEGKLASHEDLKRELGMPYIANVLSGRVLWL